MLTIDDADKLLMIPGPTPVQREILDALAVPTISHTSAPIAEIIRRCQQGICQVAGTDKATIFVFGGAGTLAQEAAVVNLVAPGDKLLVASNGFFGDRFVPIAQAFDIQAEHLAAPWGESVTPQQLDDKLSQDNYRAVTLTLVETSTGVAAPIAELATVAKRHNVPIILDAVAGLGGMPVDMDKNGIDIVLSGAQKALGVPPGLAILAVSPAALERRRSLGRIPAYYADLLNWLPSTENPQTYFSTHAVNLFYALQAATEIIEREGLDNRFARHQSLARAVRAGMGAIGFQRLTDQHYLAPTLSVLAYPEGVDAGSFLPALSRNGVVGAATIGRWTGQGVRLGHMGNVTQADILNALGAIEHTLAEIGAPVELGASVSAAQQAPTKTEVGATA